MSTFVRQTVAGNPLPPAPSFQTESVWAPTAGWNPSTPDVLAGPDSLISTQNVWIREGNLEARWKLSSDSVFDIAVVSRASNNTQATGLPSQDVMGAFSHWDTRWQNPVLLAGSGSNFYVGFGHPSTDQLVWSLLSQTSSNGSLVAPVGDATYPWYGATIYSASRDTNLAVIVGGGGANPAWCYWLGDPSGNYGSYNLAYSNLTGAPGGKDVVAFANRAVIWNTQYIGVAASPIPQRVQWSVGGDPEDWTGLGSGSEDLVDIRGNGTRIFANEAEMILASDKEIWRGQFIGDPYYFQFTPITRTIGMPFPRAALQTNDGIFWLDEDYMLWRMVGEAIQPIGQDMQTWLRDTAHTLEGAFLTYNPTLRQLRLFYSTKQAVGAQTIATFGYPNTSVTFDIAANVWTQEIYSDWFQYGLTHKHPDLAKPATNPPESIRFPHEMVFTSGATTAYFERSATSDLGNAVTEDCFLGTLGDESLTWNKTCEELRIEVAARQPSAMTLSVSTDIGRTSYWSQPLSVTSSSYVSQVIAYPKVSGVYHNLRLQSTNGAWSIPRMYAKFRRDGEAR